MKPCEEPPRPYHFRVADVEANGMLKQPVTIPSTAPQTSPHTASLVHKEPVSLLPVRLPKFHHFSKAARFSSRS